MSAVVRVREVGQGIGYEVVSETGLGRRSMAFKLHAADANEVAREIHQRHLMMHEAVEWSLGEDLTKPVLQLWIAEVPDESA